MHIFSIHEIGLYDVSAFIDYILQKTGHKSLYCIGHSQGAAATYVLNSERPEYNKKMRLMVLMAPAGFSSNSKSIFYLIARTYLKDIVDIFQKRNIYEFFSQSSIVGSALRVLCDPNFEFRVICYGLILAIAGYSPEQIDKRRLPALVHFPAGIGLKDVVHFIQLTTADEVLKYDYGEAENLVKYRQVTPPAYNLSAMVAPSAFYYGDRDALVDPLDVLRLADMFPNVVAKTLIKGFNHVDFLWGLDSPAALYKHVISVLKDF